MKNLFKPSGSKILIILLLFAVLIIAVLKYLTPTEIPAPTPSKTPVSPSFSPVMEKRNLEDYRATGGFVYRGPPVNFPARLPVLVSENKKITLEEATDAARKLGISNRPERVKDVFGKISYFFKSESAVLNFQETDQVLDYQTNSGLPPLASSSSFEKLSNSALSFLQKIGVSPKNFVTDEKSVRYYSADDEGGVVSDSLKTNYLEISYSLQDNGLKVITSYPKDLLFFALEPDGTVRQMRYQLTPDRKTGSEYALKTLNEALTELNQNKGEMVKIELQGEQNPDFNQKSFVRADLTRASLAYYYKPGETIIYPIFVFEGEGVFPDGQKAGLVIYLPAMK